MDWILSNAAKRAIVASLVAAEPEDPAAGIWNGAKMGLFQGEFVPNANQVLGDLDVADFTGYALSSAIVWGAAYSEEDGTARTEGASKQFTATDSTVTNSVTGAYIVAADGTTLLATKRYDEAKVMNGVGDAIIEIPEFELSL